MVVSGGFRKRASISAGTSRGVVDCDASQALRTISARSRSSREIIIARVPVVGFKAEGLIGITPQASKARQEFIRGDCMRRMSGLALAKIPLTVARYLTIMRSL